MKYLSIILSGCLLMACSPARAPELSRRADRLDCENVYTYILKLQTDKTDPKYEYVGMKRQALTEAIDKELIQNGAKDRFMSSCEFNMNMAQVECVLKVSTMDEMTTCVRMVH